MGHTELSAGRAHLVLHPVVVGYLLAGIEPREELKAKQLEKVIYFAANPVTWVDEDKRHRPREHREGVLRARCDHQEIELAIDRRQGR
jgi:DNA-directed RNA polymerase subunit beta'